MPVVVIYCTAAMLAAAVLPWPYGYYSLLRVVATGVFIFASIFAFRGRSPGHGFALLVLAALFNPVAPIYLTRALWAPIDLGAAIYLIAARQRISETSARA